MTRCLTGRFGRTLVLVSALLLSVATPAFAFADTLSGRVVDPSDRAVVAARVIIVRGQMVTASATTDREGRFGPVTLAPDTYDLVVSAPGLRLPATSVTIGSGASQTVALKLVLAAVTDSIVVSAAQVDMPASRVTDSVTVIDRQAIDDRQISGVADALRLVPGFGVVSSGGTGAITSLFPRGGESDYTLVLVDGIPQNAFGGGFDAAHLATADVERIEVVRGPQSALYGAGAIGGIVHVITSNGGHLRATGQVEGGGYATKAASGSVAGSLGRAVTFGGAIDWLKTDGDTSTRPSVGLISNDDYERVSSSGSVAWSDRASRRVRVDVKAGRNERGFPGPYGSDPAGNFFGLDTISGGINKTRAVGASAMLAQSGTIFHHAQINWMGETGDFTNPYGPFSSATHRATARYQVDVEQPRIGLSAGLEWLGESADSTFITGASFQEIPITRNATGFFVEARPALGGRAFANLGLRVERLDRSALEGDGFSRPAFDSQVVWSTNPKVALAWFARANQPPEAAIGWTKLRFGAGSGIKSPTAFDISFTDNPDLKPERSRSVDVGIEQAMVASRLVFDATWFHNEYDDLIVSVGSSLSGASRYKTDNIANARSQGLEFGASWHPMSAVAVRGGWTWLDTEVLGVDTLPSSAPRPFSVGQRLVRRPRSAGSLDLTWTDGPGSAFLSLNGRGSMLDLEPSFASSVFDAPGYVTTTIGGSWRVHSAITVYGRISNAFDRQYEETLGYPARGRSASIGLRVTHGH